MLTLKQLKDSELLSRFAQLVSKEREALVDIVIHLSEIDLRKLYAQEAYPSLFSYVTKKFHYSPGAAYRRIQAARLYQKFPEIVSHLKSGEVSLVTLSLIEPHLRKTQSDQLIKDILGKSQREVEDMLSQQSGTEKRHRDVVRKLPVRASESLPPKEVQRETETPTFSAGNKQAEKMEISIPKKPVQHVKIEFVAEDGVAKKLQRAREILRHKFPKGRLEDIFSLALEDLLENRDPERKAKRVMSRREKKPKETPSSDSKPRLKIVPKRSRYIPVSTQREVRRRDQGQCTFRSKSGRHCQERGMLEFDHIKPWSFGGTSSVENVRLLCRSHNQYQASRMRY